VRDVTQEFQLKSKLKEEEDRSARQMRHLFQIIHVRPELLVQFLQDAQDEIASINARLKDANADHGNLIEELFQGVHAVKGNAALVGLGAFSAKVHELENTIAGFRGQTPTWNNYLEITVQLSVIQAELDEIRELMTRMSSFQKDLEATAGSGDADLIVMTLVKSLERLRVDTGKLVSLDSAAFSSDMIPEVHRKLVKDVLVQFVRNSMIHGIERPAERVAGGKNETGQIKISTTIQKNTLELKFTDDGCGLVASKIRETAKSNPRWSSASLDSMTDAQILMLVFHPGFSTAEKVDIHAGRGVGLGLVKSRIEAAGGKIRIRTASGKGLAFDIELPLT
jgi:two-component system chemotaxis sensor kinase CheA